MTTLNSPWLRDAWSEARRRGASDLHLASGHPPQLRMGGVLRCSELPPCPPPPWAGWPEAGEGALDDPVLGRARWSLARHERGLLLVLRLLQDAIPTPSQVQLSPQQLALVMQPHGLLLVTGATGSGKSSTLAALVSHWRQQQPGHVLTLEDPVELRHPPAPGQITQREVGRDCLSFAEGLRAALRQDPDIILVGEIRDAETASLALTAAETGHLVLATLHSRTAIGAIDRLTSLFSDPMQARVQLADTLVGILAQQLHWRDGRAQALREVLVATSAVRHLIREHRLHQLETVMQTGAALGMQTLAQALAQALAQVRGSAGQ